MLLLSFYESIAKSADLAMRIVPYFLLCLKNKCHRIDRVFSITVMPIIPPSRDEFFIIGPSFWCPRCQ